jgi:serine/threonine protein kinase
VQANILVDDTPHARIADFGVAVASHYTGLPTQPGSRGTAAYKAPECIDTGEEDETTATFLPTPASDVYATAVLIWEVRRPRPALVLRLTRRQLYAGEWPYKGKNEYTIHNKTVKGLRPPRMGTRELEKPHMDPLWEVVQKGWDPVARNRCTLQEMDDVLVQLIERDTQCEFCSRVYANAGPDRSTQRGCCTVI